MIVSKYISSILKAGKRILKVRVYGKNDSREAFESAPFGTDSNPIAGMDAIFAETSDKGKQVIVGYINQNQLAGPGEHRTYSVDSTGAIKFYIWQKSDGTCEIGGSANHMTRYEGIKSGWDQMLTDLNAARAALSLPPSTADISAGKINEIKTS